MFRDFARDVIRYRWATAHGTLVKLTEDRSATGRSWLGLCAWRP